MRLIGAPSSDSELPQCLQVPCRPSLLQLFLTICHLYHLIQSKLDHISARFILLFCWQVDPDKRCSVETALAHAWIGAYVDPYPELTAREQLRHQQHLLEFQLHHQQELLAQLYCACQTPSTGGPQPSASPIPMGGGASSSAS